jgi:hypothetical protein
MTQEAVAAQTQFAPAERATTDELHQQVQSLLENELAGSLLDAYPLPAMLLNQQRQIVRANTRLVQASGFAEPSLWGLRPGEAFGCVNADDAPGGCGTADACRFCGAVLAVLEVQQGQQQANAECRIRRQRRSFEESLEMRATVTPIPIGAQRYLLITLEDITDFKRRQVFERLFFDETVSLLQGLLGLLSLLDEGGDDEALRDELRSVAERLCDEIEAQRDLTEAERGDLRLSVQPVAVHQVLESAMLATQAKAEEAGVRVRFEHEELEVVETDPQLLRRSLCLLVENAIEASEPGQTVTLRAEPASIGVNFAVHNEGVMSKAVQAQLFQRSFTTKQGTGRGLGTYTVKLLCERYLGGDVSFTTSEPEGTTVRIALPQG